MNGEIMESIYMFTKLNCQLSSSSRSILPLMDNAGCNPKDLKTKFSSIRVYFLLANTTSKLQPLDIGIIKDFKVPYHTFLRYILAKIDECDSASDDSKSVDVLVAISWVPYFLV